MSAKPVNRLSLRDQVTPLLREAILSGEFEPGQRLIEPELARRWNVSLTPIREALVTLAGSGLVVRMGRQGTYVRTLLEKDVENLLSVREALEVLAVRQAIPHLTREDDDRLRGILAQQEAATDLARTDPKRALPRLVKLNDDFHQLLLERAGNEWLASMLASITDLLDFAKTRLRRNATLQRRQESLEEHQRIMEALLRRDGETAAGHMSEHVVSLKEHVTPLLSDGSPQQSAADRAPVRTPSDADSEDGKLVGRKAGED